MKAWEALDEAPDESPAPSPVDVAEETEARLADLAERIYYIDSEASELKEQRKRALIDLEALIPETQVEPVRAADWTIEVKRGERWSWDKNILDQILEAQGITDPEDIPPFVTKSTGIKRDKFDAQPEEVRKQYMPALTRLKGTTTVKVTPDNPSQYTKVH